MLEQLAESGGAGGACIDTDAASPLVDSYPGYLPTLAHEKT